MVGIGVGSSGRISRSSASLTSNVLVFSLYLPVAKILLPVNFCKSMLLGTSRLMASELEVRR